jgi:hypothetical protein
LLPIKKGRKIGWVYFGFLSTYKLTAHMTTATATATKMATSVMVKKDTPEVSVGIDCCGAMNAEGEGCD